MGNRCAGGSLTSSRWRCDMRNVRKVDLRISFSDQCVLDLKLLRLVKEIHSMVLSGQRQAKDVEAWLQMIIGRRDFPQYLKRAELAQKTYTPVVDNKVPSRRKKTMLDPTLGHTILSQTTKITDLTLSDRRVRAEVIEWLNVLVERADFIDFLDKEKIQAREKDIYAKSLELVSRRYGRPCDITWKFKLLDVVRSARDISGRIRADLSRNGDFLKWFGQSEVDPSLGTGLSAYQFDGCMKADKLREILGQREIETTWADVFYAIETHFSEKYSSISDGGLFNKEMSNKFFIRDDRGILRVVSISWHDYWSIHVRELKDSDSWFEDTRFILPLDIKSAEENSERYVKHHFPVTVEGSFYEKLSLRDLDGDGHLSELFNTEYSCPAKPIWATELLPYIRLKCQRAALSRSVQPTSEDKYQLSFGRLEGTAYLREIADHLGGLERVAVTFSDIERLIARQSRTDRDEESWMRECYNPHREGVLLSHRKFNLFFVRITDDFVLPVVVYWDGHGDWDNCWRVHRLPTGFDLRFHRVFFRVPDAE